MFCSCKTSGVGKLKSSWLILIEISFDISLSYYRSLSLSETERECAWRPSELANLTTAGPSFLNPSLFTLVMDTLFIKSKTESDDENFAVPFVGSTWFDPVI